MILAVVVLALTNAAALAVLAYLIREQRLERQTLINRIVARNPAEVRMLEAPPAPAPVRPPPPPDELDHGRNWNVVGSVPVG